MPQAVPSRKPRLLLRRTQRAPLGAGWAALFTFLTLLGLASRVAAQGTVPERISFQGYMEDATGVPLGPTAPTNYPVIFRIFSAAAGGTASWVEKQTVTFDKGNYSLLLGQGAVVPGESNGPLSTVVANANGSDLYVESTVTINGTPATILPRLRLISTPYAFLATKALNADVARNAGNATNAANATHAASADNATHATTADNATRAVNADSADTVVSLNGSKIVDGSITAAKLDPSIALGDGGNIPDNRLSPNVALKTNNNVFYGDQTINGKLTNNGDVTVKGDVKLGATAQLSAVGGFANLQIVHGLLPALENNGDVNAVASGPGWTAARQTAPNDTRFWKVTFADPFAAPPTVVTSWGKISGTAMVGDSSGAFVSVHANGGSFIVYGSTHSDSGPVDTYFIAIGAR